MPQIRVNFHNLFRLHSDGSIEPVRSVRIGGIQFGPGVRFGRNVLFGSINLFDFIGRDFLVEEEGGTSIIVGIF